MDERRMLFSKNDTFVPHLTISYTVSNNNYDRVVIYNDDNIKYKITGENNHGFIEIMFKNEFILPSFSINFGTDTLEDIMLENETDNLITLNDCCLATDGTISYCRVYGKFKFKENITNAQSTFNLYIYGPNCIFEGNCFSNDTYNLYYYDKHTPMRIIIYGNVYAHPHVLYDLMKYNNVEEGDVKAQKYHILDNTKLYISSPTGYISKDPSVDLGNNNYIYSINNYMYEGNYITEYVCGNNITHLRNGITLPQNTTVYFPDTVIDISSNTFQDERNLKKVVIFGNCELTYLNGFKDSSLENIEIYINTIQFIYDASFMYTKLKNITIPNSVTMIKSNVFINCTSLEFINYEGTVEEWNNIDIGNLWYRDSAIKTIHCIDGDINL